MNKKSRLVSLLLTVILGPLGLMYSSIAASIVMVILAVATMPTVIIPVFLWLLSIAIGDHCTHKHNKGIDNLANIIRG